MLIAQVINQLGDKISLETALAQLPFIENPVNEIEKIKLSFQFELIINSM